LCKKNTFNDFVDVARWLIGIRALTSPDRLSCEGQSAGGLLVAASAIVEAPELFRVALLIVPFVDILCTMTDGSLPLTAGEWEEFGTLKNRVSSCSLCITL
jgi:oligopeptidase B